MAALCDIYVNDAFGTAHRAEATTHGIAKFARGRVRRPAAGGRARRDQARRWARRAVRCWRSSPAQGLDQADDPAERWPTRSISLIVGGGIANTFMLAAGLTIGKSLAEPTLVDEARAIIDVMRARGAAVPIPTDVVTRQASSADARGDRQGRRPMSPTTT